MHKLLQEAGESTLKALMREIASRSVVALAVEVARAKLYVWKEVELKERLRELEVRYRREDLEWELHKRSTLDSPGHEPSAASIDASSGASIDERAESSAEPHSP